MAGKNNSSSVRRMAVVVLTLVIQIAAVLISAGKITWIWGWILFGLGMLILIINGIVLPKDLIEERGKHKDNVKGWDKILVRISIIPYFLLYIIAGLDQRFGWTGGISIFVNVSGAIIYLSGNLLFTWAMVSNNYFSTSVRIQNDRGHRVATGGPYRFVRHPGYTGYILSTAAASLVLGSLWGLIPAGITSVIFIIRTYFEDKMLQNELEGYSAFVKEVRFRLIPGIW